MNAALTMRQLALIVECEQVLVIRLIVRTASNCVWHCIILNKVY